MLYRTGDGDKPFVRFGAFTATPRHLAKQMLRGL